MSARAEADLGRIDLDLDCRDMYAHYVLYGTGAVCEAAGIQDVHLGWDVRGMTAIPYLTAPGLTAQVLGEVVLAHVRHHAQPGTWLWEDSDHVPDASLMSPRSKALNDKTTDEQWARYAADRARVEQELEDQGDWLSLSLVGALGEGAWWRHNSTTGKVVSHEGASRLDMQSRNAGGELVKTRLRALASAVSKHTVQQVADGVMGLSSKKQDSQAATNLRPPKPTDYAQAWVALWGISQTGLAPQVASASITSTHVGASRRGEQEHFVLPVWEGPWSPSKLRAVLASGALKEASALAVTTTEGDVLATANLRTLWRTRGVEAYVVFPIQKIGGGEYPSMRAVGGRIVTALND